jgi:hypothetical protein
MLLITKAQRQKVGDPAFVTRVLSHMKLYYAHEFYHLSDEDFGRRIAHCVEKARERGFTYERTLTMFTANMMRINPKFYEQPAIARIIGDTSRPEEQRLEAAIFEVTGRDWDDAERQCDAAEYWRPIDGASNKEA